MLLVPPSPSPASAAALLLRLHDRDLGGHSLRVSELSAAVAHRLGLPAGEVRDVALAGLLHDVGKLAIPASILDKPDRLAPGEWDVVRGHALLGERTLRRCPELVHLAPLVRHVSERWDGTGRPEATAARTSRSARASSAPATPGTRCAPSARGARR